MFKLRLLMAALAVIASAGLINCSKMKANHSTPEAGPELNSEQPLQNEETEAERAARLLREKMEYRSSLVADLQSMSSMAYGEEACSSSDLETLKNQQSNPELLSAYDSIASRTLGLKTVIFGSDKMVKDMNAAENKYCAVSLGAMTADYALTNFMLHNNHAIDITTAEDYDKLVEKAEQVVKKLLPVMKNLVQNIEIAERAQSKEMKYGENVRLIEAIQEQLSQLTELNTLIRASYSCDETQQNCSIRDIAYSQATVNAVTDMNQAKEALENAKVRGTNDPSIDAKNNLLKTVHKALNMRLGSARQMVAIINQEASGANTGSATDLDADHSAAAVAAGQANAQADENNAQGSVEANQVPEKTEDPHTK